MDTRLLYTALVVVVALGRLAELRIANRNFQSLVARGGMEAGAEHYRWMVLLHVLFLAACPLEVWLLDRPFIPALAAVMLVLLSLAALLRWWVISSLEGRWTTRVVVLPGMPPVTRGPYRFLRHPNYLAVIVEIFSLPLVHTAWLTALVFSLSNAVMLRVRIRAEEAALARASNYEAAFSGRPRLVPGGR
jgi:methyltransferase